MPLRVDLNCDMGEGAPNDAALMRLITSANIACGGHAGDEETMGRTAVLALQHGVSIGAHPSFADRANFGRKEIQVEPQQLTAQIVEQIRALQRTAGHQGIPLRHVKPHGALYNLAAHDEVIACAVIEAVKTVDSKLPLFVLAGSPFAKWARDAGLTVAEEVFADRGYRADGSLVPRSQPGAMIKSPPEAAARVVRMIKEGKVAATDGGDASVRADTICLHGDEPEAPQSAAALRKELEKAGIEVKRFGAT